MPEVIEQLVSKADQRCSLRRPRNRRIPKLVSDELIDRLLAQVEPIFSESGSYVRPLQLAEDIQAKLGALSTSPITSSRPSSRMPIARWNPGPDRAAVVDGLRGFPESD